MNEGELKNHYINNGIYENRIYKITLPHDFNCSNYRYLNYDLQDMSDENIKNHYIELGYYEKRTYKTNLPNNFIPFNYKFLNNDLFDMNDEELKTHYINHGFYENRFYKIDLPDYFNSNNYKNLNNDLHYMNDEELKDHFINYGFYENRAYNIIFKNNIDLNNYNYDEANKNKILNVLDNIKIYAINKIKKYEIFNNIDINFFSNDLNEDYIYKNLEIIKMFENENDNINLIIINNNNISFDYLKYFKYPINKLLNKYIEYYDIIELTAPLNENDFYNNIESEISVNPIIQHNLDCYYISSSGIKKILNNINNNNNILNNIYFGRYSRPLFGYLYDELKLWDQYYNVTTYWDKIYCINLGLDIEKKNKILDYCNLLNCDKDDFFYDGILGLNLPDFSTLQNMNIYHDRIKEKFNIKKGAIGLNIAQYNIICDAINNNYDSVLILEDDIYFKNDYFKTLNILFNKYTNIDILYLGYTTYENNDEIFDKIDTINNYSILKPKNNLLQKICVGGFFAILLSKKALKIFKERFEMPIKNISDVLLCDISFNIKNDSTDYIMKKTNYNLNNLFIYPDMFNVIIDKPSLTEENNFNILTNFKNNKNLLYLSKIKKITFKNNNKYNILIYIGNTIKTWPKLIEILLLKFNNYKIVDYIDDKIDIVLYHEFDNLVLNEHNLNITINCENRDSDNLADIVILTNRNFKYNYNIYLPYLFGSLWERRQNYKNILNNIKDNFCAYMYSYDLEYRVELYNFISKYKKVDALGKSCSNIINDDRFVSTDKMTYNDIAVEKYSKYKFVLALENGISEGYITEKLINPIIAGSIPIYCGPNDVFNIINIKRIIYVYNFSNYQELLNYIIEVDNNETLYNSIISEKIFIGNLNWDNYEDYLSNHLDISLGFKKKNILISDEIYNINNINCKNNLNINFYINNFNVFNYNNDTIKRYLNDYINKDDIIIDKKLNNKINFIDHIVWINLNRSIKRRENLEKLLSNIIIKNSRIEAIDGKIHDVRKFINPIETNITNIEIATTLSHIKAINYLKNITGNYFLICEDDILFDNIYLLDTNIEKIIKDAPEFDILLLTKIYTKELDNLYTCWNTESQKHSDYGSTIWSAASYIISRKGIDNICNLVSYNNDTFNFNINYIHVADLFLFKFSKTYVYKYNFINTLDINSTIHEEQLDYQKASSEFQLNLIKNSYINYIINDKINFINNIMWINLDRSINRRTYMENLFKNINIQNTRINAMDGNNLNNELLNLKSNKNMTKYEIATTLSHIKAINYLKNITGDYFLICEDDIACDNLIYFKEKTLKNIINEAPKFDILLLHKTYLHEVNNLYSDWKYYYDKGLDYTIFSAVSYIISRDGINKITNLVEYIDDNNFNFKENIDFNVSDIFLYLNCKTYVYKYNFFNTNNCESTIHNEQVQYQKKCENIQLNIIKKNKNLI